jgi:predicted dinucleotide-binding enzyme
MRIGILGSGVVGQTLGARLVEIGHDVMVGTTKPARLDDWLAAVGKGGSVGSFAEAAAHGDLVVVATKGEATLEVLARVGADKLSGKVLLDVTNPLDFSKGMPPTLFVSNTDSLGEQIQRAHPHAWVVKSLNTVNSAVMVDPGQLADGDHTMFLCGDDDDAKRQVVELLRGFGWKDIIDLGDITNARGLESLLPLWVRLWGAIKSPAFSIKVVR